MTATGSSSRRRLVEAMHDSGAAGARIERLLRLVNLVHSTKARSADQLAARLGVSRRTVFRDVRTLQRAGFR